MVSDGTDVRFHIATVMLALKETSSYFDVSTPTIHMISGMAAGFLSTTITHPFDMLKTRMQLKPADYRNVFQAARKVLLVRLFR
jgi:solute carrier family 25 protein 38